ncbi:dihydrodipicolinate synthase family protein [Eilatimonas milleporae]|uniref:4-hydroxy-tetrahydrodipicolinate synthase n=1 Tax=Eilatimonas milleporae TaxID=911205 RepID=A0A3M0CRB6_9PROT|nr:dihydrodipicolinate synthase family protein [Eilatimonas milleporae]RMB12091.1 4-hydroxy-tetrahydrodipicolinate synthase [Eilatimonas milleporae]
MSKEFRGSYTVAITPFTEDGSAICVPSLRRFIDWQVDSGVPGIIVLGTTGEFLTLTEEEREQVVAETVSHVNGRMDVLVGTMDAHTPRAVRFSRQAERLGAQGVMVIPPYYYTPTNDEIFNYYKAIAESISIPIMLYNNPFTSNVDMSAAMVARLTKAFDNVRYIKEASMDVGRVYDIVEATDGVMNVFAGERPVESHLLGAVGYVNPYGNYLPWHTTRMWDYLVEGHRDRAEEIQRLLVKIDHIIAEGHPTYGHQCYSKALSAAAGYPVGDVRPPLMRFDDLGQEGIDRRTKVVALMKQMDDLLNSYE